MCILYETVLVMQHRLPQPGEGVHGALPASQGGVRLVTLSAQWCLRTVTAKFRWPTIISQYIGPRHCALPLCSNLWPFFILFVFLTIILPNVEKSVLAVNPNSGELPDVVY